MSIFCRDRSIGTRRVDFFVENSIMVEIKAITKLEDVHLAQALNYLECYKIQSDFDKLWSKKFRVQARA